MSLSPEIIKYILDAKDEIGSEINYIVDIAMMNIPELLEGCINRKRENETLSQTELDRALFNCCMTTEYRGEIEKQEYPNPLLEIISILLNYKATSNRTFLDRDGEVKSSISIAMNGGNYELFELLLERGFPEGINEDILIDLIRESFEYSEDDGFTMNILGAFIDQIERIKNKREMLWFACFSGNIEGINFFLEMGIDPTEKLFPEIEGSKSCLELASEKCKEEVIFELIKYSPLESLKNIDFLQRIKEEELREKVKAWIADRFSSFQ